MIFIFYLDQVDYDGYCLEYYQGVYQDQTENISIDVEKMNVKFKNSLLKMSNSLKIFQF